MFPLERSSRSAPFFFCGGQLENRDLARKAYDYALDLLSARAYTIRNLRRKLVQREYAADEPGAEEVDGGDRAVENI